MNLKCRKCGSEKFTRPAETGLVKAVIDITKTRQYACFECGHVAKVKTVDPEFITVTLGPNDKVVE